MKLTYCLINNTYLQYPCDGTTTWQLVPVEREAGNPYQHPQHHKQGTDNEAKVPAFTVLHPHDEDEPHEATRRDGESVPVEEARLLPLLYGIGRVELLPAQSREARPSRAIADGDQVEAQQEQAQV